jgi:hypothetical protein
MKERLGLHIFLTFLDYKNSYLQTFIKVRRGSLRCGVAH